MDVSVSETFIENEVITSSGLDYYRKMASFCSTEMNKILEPGDRLSIKNFVWSKLESDPLFHPLQHPVLSIEEKRLTARQLVKYLKCGLFDHIHSMPYAEKTRYLMVVNEATEIFNPSLSIKFALGISLFSNAIYNLGTDRHNRFYNDVWSGKLLSCLALTELGHGSDTKRMKTTATYNHSTREFIINTPSMEAAKCWVGNLGMQCSHALLFAQLIVKDVCHGLHAFIVPIRDPVTNSPYPNITVGDMGDKGGLHGIDNGYVLFKNYRIPKENLLNRTGDVNESGEYETSFTDPQRILGAALESLSAGRIGVMMESCNSLTKSIIIAVRYAAQRKQFADSKDNELPIIEYQSHQWRLFPYLAASYAIKSFLNTFYEQYTDCVAKSIEGDIDLDEGTLTVTGVHALVSCSKAYISWTARDAIQEAREACGGHGVLKGAGLVDLRNNHDPRVTFEGDNTVLLQQTSNWLLRRFAASSSEQSFSSFPLSSISFFSRSHIILTKRFSGHSPKDVLSSSFINECYEWLICWLCKTTLERKKSLEVYYDDPFAVKSMYQVYKARNLAIAFAEYNILNYFWKSFINCKEGSLRQVLEHLYYLFGLWSLYKHIPLLYQGGYSSSPDLVQILSDTILNLCTKLKKEAVSLVDAASPPDFILNSILGYSDGKVYTRLFEEISKGTSAPLCKL